MLYCLNPTCFHPQNCLGCGQNLAKTAKVYYFRDRYRVIKFLGDRLFSRTYQAEDLNFHGKPCVIKKIIPQLQGIALKQAQDLFERKAVILTELNHPQISRVYSRFQDENYLYFIRE
jgi:serine/threonine protein kinase